MGQISILEKSLNDSVSFVCQISRLKKKMRLDPIILKNQFTPFSTKTA
jgi:hypothetical protein